MPYIGTSPSNGVRRKHTYTATASQTSFSGAGAEGATLSYNDSNFVDVYQNGVKLSEADYTSTSGTAIVLAQGASADDIVEVVVFDVFSVADTVSKSAGGSFDSAVTMSSGLRVADGGNIGSASDTDAMAIASNGVVTFSQIPVLSSGGAIGLTRATEVDTTSGVVIDFTGIPAGTKFIKLIGAGISHNAASTGVPSSYNMVQIGDSGGFETSGYTGSFFEQNSNGSDGSCRDMTNSSTGTNGASWAVTKATSASSLMNITVDMRLIDEDTFTWAYSFVSSFNGTGVSLGAGAKTLSAELTQVRFGTVGGNNTFDAGKMTIQFE